VNVIGATTNIPLYGPVIFVPNHASQFIDSVVVLSTCQRTISFLMAEKSYKKRIVGEIAWAMNVVPVKRAQDDARKGSGFISIEVNVNANACTSDDDAVVVGDDSGNVSQENQEKEEAEIKMEETDAAETAKTEEGEGEDDKDNDNDNKDKDDKAKDTKNYYIIRGVNGTQFTKELNPRDKIRFPNCPEGLKITSIQSDTEMIAEGVNLTSKKGISLPSPTPLEYDIMKRVELGVVYEKVLSKLAAEGTIGIFPEGGSHDRTDLLPLKAGVALIAYSAMEKYGLSIPIVPVGLNYFKGHKIRGRVTVEYGRPIHIDPATLKDYLNGGESKRKVCNDVLERIEDSLRSVIVSAPDYKTLKMIHTARRLYRDKYMSSSEKQDLSRRFAEGYKQLLLMTQGNPPQSWLDLQERLRDYQKELDELGIRDYQVPGLVSEQTDTEADQLLRLMRIPFRIAELLLLLLVSLIPGLFLNAPVGIIAHYWAIWRRKKALAGSKVKIKGMDVMLTEKVLLCIVLVPTLWISYGLSLYCFSDIDLPTLALFFYSFPLFSYMGIVTSEAGMVELKDLKPFLKRLFPSTKRRMMKLPAVRKKLQADLRDFIRMIGPSLGDVYSEKKLNWADFQQNMRRHSKLNLNHLSETKKDV